MDATDISSSVTNENGKQTRVVYRYVVTTLMFFGLVIMQIMRVDLSVAIVAMVNHNQTLNNGTSTMLLTNNSNQSCPYFNAYWNLIFADKNLHHEGFDWDQITQGKILGSYSYGLLISQLIGGHISDLIGFKVTIGMGMLFSSILTFISPLVANDSYFGLMIVRTLLGMSQGVVIPCISCCVSRWIPKQERTLLHGIMRTGNNFGALIATEATGLISQSSILGGWPLAFYIFGSLGLVWCATLYFLMHEHPTDHPHISPKEKKHISSHMSAEGHHQKHSAQKKVTVPWKSVAKSHSIWTCALAMFATSWGANTFNNHLPSFVGSALHYNIDSNGFLSSLHYLSAVPVIGVTGKLADWALKEGHLSDTNIRKIFAGVANIIGPLILVSVTFIGCEQGQNLIIGLITAGSALIGAAYPSLEVAIINMSPTHSGTLSGFVSGVGDTAGIISSYVVGLLTENNETCDQWNKVFYISAAVIFVLSLPFYICGSAELQHWSIDSDSDKSPDKPDDTKVATAPVTPNMKNTENKNHLVRDPTKEIASWPLNSSSVVNSNSVKSPKEPYGTKDDTPVTPTVKNTENKDNLVGDQTKEAVPQPSHNCVVVMEI